MSDLLPGQLFNAPAEPHAWDDEFEGTVLDSKWTVFGNLVSAAPSLDAVVAGTDIRIAVGQRPSWLRMQPGVATDVGANVGIRYTPSAGVELPDGTYWTRYAPRWRRPSQINNDAQSGIVLLSDANPSTRYIFYGMELDAGTANREFTVQDGGPLQVGSTNLNERGEAQEYLAIIRVGSQFDAWNASGAGAWARRSSFSYVSAIPIDSFGLRCSANQSVNPGNLIQSFDFIRYLPLNQQGNPQLP